MSPTVARTGLDIPERYVLRTSKPPRDVFGNRRMPLTRGDLRHLLREDGRRRAQRGRRRAGEGREAWILDASGDGNGKEGVAKVARFGVIGRWPSADGTLYSYSDARPVRAVAMSYER